MARPFSTSLPNGEQHHQSIPFEHADAGELASVDTSKFDSRRRLSSVAKPLSDSFEVAREIVLVTVEELGDRIAEQVSQERDGQIASLTMEMSTPATAAAKPFRVVSHRATRPT